MSEFEYLPDLVYCNILTFLNGEDLLNLRKVSRTTKYWVENFKQSHEKWSNYQMSFGKYRDGEKYLKSGLQLKSIRIPGYSNLNPSWPYITTQFLEQCSPFITKLRVENYAACKTKKDYIFFSSFVNLKEFEIGQFFLSSNFWEGIQEHLPMSEETNQIPLNFKNLKVLKVDSVIPGEWEEEFFWELMAFPSLTETLVAPKREEFQFEPTSENLILKNLNKLMEIVTQRETLIQNQNQTSNSNSTISTVKAIKQIDLRHNGLPGSSPWSTFFFPFLKLCFQKGIKLINLSAESLRLISRRDNDMHDPTPWIKEAVNKSIVSLIGFNYRCLKHSWENLETLTVGIGMQDFYAETLPLPPVMPKLKTLSVYLYSNTNTKVKILLDALFPLTGTVERSKIENLTMTFVRNDKRVGQMRDPEMIDASRIIKNAPHLKKIKMVQWKIMFETLFNGLKSLEELWIEDCPTFSDEDMIGEDVRNPIFLNLITLKKLTLKIDSMPLVTDKALILVLSKMRLRELHILIDNSKTFRHVTTNGLAALAEGVFGSTITKFTFKKYTVKDILDAAKKPDSNNNELPAQDEVSLATGPSKKRKYKTAPKKRSRKDKTKMEEDPAKRRKSSKNKRN